MIAEFYNNSEIFITGGTGYVGLALIEKLLRSCNVKRIYVLIRTKRNKDFNQRLDKIRNHKIFHIIRQTDPAQLNKLTAIPGDALLPNLGITPEYEKILENVDAFFHCAATVNFDEPLDYALRLNVGATLSALKLAESLKNLRIFLHVSTLYSNPYLKYVEPNIYKPVMDWKFCLNLTKNMQNKQLLDILTKKLTIGFPNTYTFTKHLAESLVNDYRGHFAIGIYRPSIVLYTLCEPQPGLAPALVGAMGLFALVAAGVQKVLHLRPDVRLDITPLDCGTVAMLYYAIKSHQIYQNGEVDKVPVFIFSSIKYFDQSFKDLCNTVNERGSWETNAFNKNFLVPRTEFASTEIIYIIMIIFRQLIPAILVDMILHLCGKKPLLMHINRRAFHTFKVMEPFLFNSFDSPGMTDEDNLKACTRGTDFDLYKVYETVQDKEIIHKIHTTMLYYVRENFLHEDPKTIPRARKIIKIKRYLYQFLRGIFIYHILRWIYRRFFADIF